MNKYEDHKLTGNWAGHKECHIEPDWLLIYYIENDTPVGKIIYIKRGDV